LEVSIHPRRIYINRESSTLNVTKIQLLPLYHDLPFPPLFRKRFENSPYMCPAYMKVAIKIDRDDELPLGVKTIWPHKICLQSSLRNPEKKNLIKYKNGFYDPIDMLNHPSLG
jgi:hypothetical protein